MKASENFPEETTSQTIQRLTQMGLVQKLQGHICAFKSICFKREEEGVRLGSASERKIQSICSNTSAGNWDGERRVRLGAQF